MTNLNKETNQILLNSNDSTKLIIEPKIMNEIFLKYFEKTDKLYFLLNDHDTKIIKFLLKYILVSKKNSFHFLIRKRHNFYKINSEQKTKFSNVLESSKLILKLINIFFFIDAYFMNLTQLTKEIINKKVYHIITKLFVKNIISMDDMKIIIGYNLLKCLYQENKIFQTKNTRHINKNITNIKELYSLIDFLISFTKIQFND